MMCDVQEGVKAMDGPDLMGLFKTKDDTQPHFKVFDKPGAGLAPRVVKIGKQPEVEEESGLRDYSEVRSLHFV